MKRSTARWTTWIAAAGLIALPIITSAQTPQPAPQPAPAPTEQPRQTPQPAQPPERQQPTTSPPQTQAPPEHASRTAQEHLRQAKAALAGIPDTAVAGTARTRLTDLRRHIAALERAAAAPAQTATPSRGQRRAGYGRQNWASEVAAIDRVLTQMIGPSAVTGAGSPPATTGATGTTGTKGQAAVTMDEATRGKLMEVRTHITAFAAAMSGTGQQASAMPPATTTPSPTSPSPAQPATTTATAPVPPRVDPQQPAPTTTQPPTDPQQPVPAQPTTATTTQPPTPAPSQPSTTTAAQAGYVNPEEAKRHLTAARDTLSQLTQLPEAAQLTGDARTQVSQLIANFNELITTQSEWRAAFSKVQDNLTALIGAERTDESNVPPPATATAGAVGTSGVATLDPKIREKLAEFRRHLNEFQRVAVGGGGAK